MAKEVKKPTSIREALIWSIANNDHHSDLTDEEKQIVGVEVVAKILFPGINYYSLTGFGAVFLECVQPLVRKLFPDLVGKAEMEVLGTSMVEVASFLPCDGYRDNAWIAKFNEKLEVL
jgi:hypothetical protein